MYNIYLTPKWQAKGIEYGAARTSPRQKHTRV